MKPFAFSATLTVLIALGIAAQAADTAAAGKNPMLGEWKVTTVGKQGQYGQDPKALSQTFTLVFEEKKVKGKAFTGKPFGFDVVSSRCSPATAGGSVSFSATYERGGGSYTIDFRGKLSQDAKTIADGRFSMIMGSGTFTAEKQ